MESRSMQYNIQLNENQENFFNSIKSHKTICDSGTWRSGKSFQLCLFMILRMMKYDGIREFIGRKTLASLKETTFLKFQEILSEHMGMQEGIDFSVTHNPVTIRINNSVCVFGDLDINRIGKWLSSEYSDIGIDEAQEIQQLAFEKIKSRQTQKITGDNKFVMVMNPPENSNQHWIHKRFRDPLTSIKNSIILYSKIEANIKNIPAGYIKEMTESVDPRTAEIYLKGLWVPLNTNIVYADYLFPQDENGKYISGGNLTDREWDSSLETYFSMDFGWTHEMTIGVWNYDRENDISYRVFEFVKSHVKPEQYCTLLAGEELDINGKRYKLPCSCIGHKIIVGSEAKQKRQESDGINNKSMIETGLKKHGIAANIHVVSPRMVKSISNVRSHILTTTGKRRILINYKYCNRFINDATVYHYPTDKEGNVIGEIPFDDGISDHTQDDARYYISYIKPTNNSEMWSTQDAFR